MTLRCEEMQSSGRYVRVTAHASVFCCDHSDDRGHCERGYLIGLGDGDSVTSEEIAAAEDAGWLIGDGRDYCPEHAGLHASD